MLNDDVTLIADASILYEVVVLKIERVRRAGCADNLGCFVCKQAHFDLFLGLTVRLGSFTLAGMTSSPSDTRHQV